LKSDTEGINPMVSVTKIDPKEIPEVNNKFLMRGERPPRERNDDEEDKNGHERKRGSRERERNFGWSKRSVPNSRSGRVIKGRGNFRYRTPIRSRSRSFTPEHWKAAQRNLIKMSDYEKREEDKKMKEDEIKRRAEERKRRHEAIAKSDGKKSFFELSQEVTVASVEISKEPEKANNDELDYEADETVEEVIELKKDEAIRRDRDEKARSDKARVRSRSRSRDFERNRERRDFRDKRNDERHRNDRNDRFGRRDDREKEKYRRKSRSRSRSR
jgi:peptidyl-prolyl isomerase G (cyclophilin G)